MAVTHKNIPPVPLHSQRMVVIIATLVAMLLAAGAVWATLSVLPHVSQSLPVRQVVFVSAGDEPLREIDHDQLKRLTDALQTRGALMLQLDLPTLRDSMKQIAWVREVNVRRRFPSTVVVAIEEHKPVAVWTPAAPNAGQADNTLSSLLVNSYGEVFRAVISDERKAAFPHLGGPDGSATEVLEKYAAMLASLKAIERAPAKLVLTARRAWQVTLDNGSVLQLGRGEVDTRLTRFIQTYPRLAALQAAKVNVDLRYQRGFAIRGTGAATDAPIRQKYGSST